MWPFQTQRLVFKWTWSCFDLRVHSPGGWKWKSLLGLWCLLEIMGIALSGAETGLSTAQQCGHLCQILCTLGVRTFFSSSTSGFSSQMPVMPSVPLAIPKHRIHTRYIDPTVLSQNLRTHTSFSRSPMSPSHAPPTCSRSLRTCWAVSIAARNLHQTEKESFLYLWLWCKTITSVSRLTVFILSGSCQL